MIRTVTRMPVVVRARPSPSAPSRRVDPTCICIAAAVKEKERKTTVTYLIMCVRYNCLVAVRF
jgi:hypothetical protein